MRQRHMKRLVSCASIYLSNKNREAVGTSIGKEPERGKIAIEKFEH